MLSFLLLSLAADPLPLAEGDRVAFLGGTFVEREQQSGHWETALTLANRGKAITFRNLAWSGDTVRGESRAAFDPPAKGYQRLIELTREVKPTLIVCCYGANESFAGESGRESFRKDYERLLNDIAPTMVRVVLMTPIPFEAGPGMGDVPAKNASLASYCDTIRSIAAARNASLIDLFGPLTKAPAKLTENGLHPTANGYRQIAKMLVADAKDDPAVRAAIVAKNELFFHRWRPQNETYLFGFRKHEQGKNAKEIVEFDPLIAKAEEEIRNLMK
jgi:lysophospholipase L1-like esterase